MSDKDPSLPREIPEHNKEKKGEGDTLSDLKADMPLWTVLILIPAGLAASGLGAYFFYDMFWKPQPLLRATPRTVIFSVACVAAGFGLLAFGIARVASIFRK